jgi:hypothetical protein
MFNGIQSALEGFFGDLNWTYIIIYAIILYGVKYKPEFIWYNDLFKKGNWVYLKTWVAGVIVGLFFCLFHWGESEYNLAWKYVSQLLRSWVVVIVFNAAFTSNIEKIENNSNNKNLGNGE